MQGCWKITKGVGQTEQGMWSSGQEGTMPTVKTKGRESVTFCRQGNTEMNCHLGQLKKGDPERRSWNRLQCWNHEGRKREEDMGRKSWKPGRPKRHSKTGVRSVCCLKSQQWGGYAGTPAEEGQSTAYLHREKGTTAQSVAALQLTEDSHFHEKERQTHTRVVKHQLCLLYF